MRKDKKEIKQAVDETCDLLIVAIGQQLLEAVQSGEKLREAIDWVKLHKRSVTEYDALNSSKDPSDYFDSLVSDIIEDKNKKLRR